jgi:hypothetical protein
MIGMLFAKLQGAKHNSMEGQSEGTIENPVGRQPSAVMETGEKRLCAR